ncbi:(2Fe-2S)-binding protein [Nocardia cyriacigeorgica]|uniref:(2Fe-2S)-binding protein n=1 Tax=Nocardia cyriacigeorgica TaxID=135487 RepID=UPI002458790E|nr:(2Fe-2S)-binding protein [Nocardia cyriacigeorgica]
MNTVPGRTLTDPDWLTARIAEMGESWGTGSPRIGGTLWWCMVASALVEPIARAYAAQLPAPSAELDRIACEVRPDGGVDRIVFGAVADDEPTGETRSVDPDGDACSCTDTAERAVDEAVRDGRTEEPGNGATPAGTALQETLTAVIAQVAAVSGARPAALWAVVADAIGNRAIDAGAPAAGTRLATDIGGRLPSPRFTEIGARTFVRRISCCLVYEVPGCQMCTSCPKRPAAERERLLTELAARA